MRSFFGVFLLSLLCSPSSPSQTVAKDASPTTIVEHRMMELEHEKDEAYQRGDKPALDRLYASDYVAVAANGNSTTKQEVLGIFSRPNVYESYKSEDMTVRVFGDTAVVTGRLKFKYFKDITPAFKGQLRYTNIYVKQQGQWIIVASQFTPIQK